MSPAAELAALRAKLAAREAKGGFGDNVREMKARIAELERAQGNG